jgi:protein-disulfide isomerase
MENNEKEHWFTKRSSPRLCFWLGVILGGLIACLAGLAFIGYLYSGGQFNFKQDNINTNLNDETERLTVQNLPKKEVVLGDYNYFLGSASAPVTLVLYTDFECQICKIYQKNIEDFVKANSEKVNLTVKNFILTQKHPQAEAAAQAAICAGEQNKYYEYADELFANQSLLNNDFYLLTARELELDEAEFSACLNSEEIQEKITEDFNEGISLGVSGIPGTIIIHPDKSMKLIDGNVSQDFLQSLLKDYL